MQILNRVLQCNDMRFPVVVDFINNRRKRRRLSASRRSRYKHKSSLFPVQLNNGIGYSQCLRRRHNRIHQTKCHSRRAPLLIDIDTVTPLARNGKGHIDLALLLKTYLLHIVHHRLRDCHGIRGHKTLPLHHNEFAVHPHFRGDSNGDMYVGRARFFRCRQDFFYCLWHTDFLSLITIPEAA